MTTKTVITSFTDDGYEKYGRKFIETFSAHWPSGVRLVVYYEGKRPQSGWHSIEEVALLKEWMTIIKPFSLFSGYLFDQYDIKFDARTNRVIFMQNHALRTYGGKVFWIDADVVTHADVPPTFLDDMLPDDKLCCYLGRHDSTGARWYDSETGFIGFNYDHPQCEEFLKIEESTLFQGIIFAQQCWWDMSCFDWAREAFCAKDPTVRRAFRNLASELPDGCMHPFINAAPGAYMDHLKGVRKGGRSLRDDLMVERTEPYWTCPEAYGGSETKAA